MCGIAGKIDLQNTVDAGLLERMCEVLEHRGPDSRGVHLENGVGLGVQRLAVIDLEHGDQPIYSEDRSSVVVLNGEIYNYIELRDQLIGRGHTFRTGSDTETIVHLYEELGARCVDQLRGMFAFAVWDSAARRVLLARDRVGKKPLFYRATETALWFASEPRALLLDPEVPRDIDTSALDSYLRFQYVPHPASAFAGIRKLPPGHVLSWAGGEPEISRYWRLEHRAQDRCTMQEASEIVRQSLLEATRLRLRSDVPLGAFLSGGVDSSAVVAAMAMEGSGRVKTFSIGFDVEGYDETAFAREVAQRYDTEHHEFRVDADAIGILPRLVWHYGEPFADSSALPSFYLSELTRRHVTVALNGDGGDESFAGYIRYVAQSLAGRMDLLPDGLRRVIAAAARTAGHGARSAGFRSRATRVLSTIDEPAWQRYDTSMSYFTRAELGRLYEPDFAASLPQPPLADALIGDPWTQSNAGDIVGVMLDVDTQTYLPGDLLVKMDIATMAHSLEVRSPLLDHVLMERVARLPSELKLRGRSSKRLLKEAVRPWLPDSVIERRKMGFGVPIASWFRTSLAQLPEEVLLDPRTTGRGIFRPSMVRQLVDDHRSAAAENSAKLWSLLQLELWFRTYVDCAEPTQQTLATVG
ncbi:MAG: asparagine synthase (glutamine-hydrolyzing) [Solirubrobacteraceae bacterium]